MEQREPTRTRSCSDNHAGPFELMFNIQLGKAILAFLSLVIFNEVNYFLQMVQETGPVLLALGVTVRWARSSFSSRSPNLAR